MSEQVTTNLPDKELPGDQSEKREANACLAMGAGVGVLGAASAVIGGAVCPLCVVVAPALIGIGAYKRWKSNSTANNTSLPRSFKTSKQG